MRVSAVAGAYRADPSGTTALLLTAGVVAALGGDAWLRAVRTFEVPNAFVTSQYYADYRDGYLRRALPGEMLGWLPGQPTDAGIGLVMVLGIAAAAAGLLWLAVRTAALATGPLARLTVLIVLLTSPLWGLSLLPRDVGRPDAWGMAGLAGLTAVGLAVTDDPQRSRGWRHRLAASVLVAGILTVLTALTDFLLPLAAIICALIMVRLWGPATGQTVGSRAWLPALAAAALTVLPAFTLLAWSIAAPPSVTEAYAIQVRAGREPGSWDAALFLTQSAGEAWGYVRFIGWTVPATAAVMAILLLLTGVVLAHLTGRADRLSWVLLGCCALASLVIAIDVRRYWVLALLVFAACLVLRPGRPGAGPPATGWQLRTAIGVLLICALLGQNLPLLISSEYLTDLRVALTGGAVN